MNVFIKESPPIIMADNKPSIVDYTVQAGSFLTAAMLEAYRAPYTAPWREINRESFLAAMREVVVERGGEYVGRRMYYDGGQDGACIIGAIMVKFGVHPATLGTDAMHVLRTRGVSDLQLLTVAGRAQLDNDRGDSWGTILDNTETRLRYARF